MQIRFAFGRHGLDVILPDGPRYEVIESRSASPLPDVTGALDQALDHPIGCKPLSFLAAGKKTAAISVCDITRPAPNWLTLPPLLRRLHDAGIPADGITIMIATGLHREATPSEINAILGPEIAAKCRVVNHDARVLAQHRWLGKTHRGIPVYIDERFMAADLHITLGFIEQHLMLGFSGGRKLVAPGLAGQGTIKVIHSPGFMREALAVEGSIDANPIHAELLEIARMARHDFILDVTLTQSREISGIFAGDPVQAHAAGVAFMRRSSVEFVPELVDAAITSAAGMPLDLTFYQTIKGITAAQHIVKPGGKILIVSECSEGIGSPEFAEKLRNYTGAQSFLDEIRDTPVVPDQWQLEKLALVALKHPLTFYAPGTRMQQLGALGAQSFSNVHDAVDDLVRDLPQHARVAIIPDGPYACARVEPAV